MLARTTITTRPFLSLVALGGRFAAAATPHRLALFSTSTPAWAKPPTPSGPLKNEAILEKLVGGSSRKSPAPGAPPSFGGAARRPGPNAFGRPDVNKGYRRNGGYSGGAPTAPAPKPLATRPVPVQYIDAEGKDMGVCDLRALVRDLDRTEYDLVQVATRPAPDVTAAAPAATADAPDSAPETTSAPRVTVTPGTPIPVVRLVSRREAYARAKDLKARARNAPPERTEKEVQIGASVSPHDLSFKVTRAAGFLRKGYKVKVVIRHKGRGDKAPAAKDKLVAEIVESLRECTASVAKPPAWEGRDVAVTLVGRKSAGEAKETAEEEDEDDD
ncbi:hypothetical protein BC828DRAFT_414056 [Blastocladiella britannica]|nr:hypothetical protein BC828DRAFT_414056 [Blastocladiella britannica]